VRPPRSFVPVAALLLATLVVPARAGETCPTLFADGRSPVVVNARLAADAVALCYSAFAILYSGRARTPLYAAERLTRRSVAQARSVERVDTFHEEDRLPPDQRARLDDYSRSGFDRGHMAPAGDMPDAEAQAESFTLANIVPQDRTVNRGTWAAIEESVRRLAIRRATLFVVTGPLYEGAALDEINGRVLVPTGLYKAVYDPARNEAGAYLAPNRADGEWQAVSLDALRARAGIDVFPALSDAAKARAMDLPEPHEFSRDGTTRRQEAGFWAGFETWAKRELHRLLRHLWRELMKALF